MNTIKTHLKAENFSHIYLFTGEEIFLAEFYAKKLKNALVAEGDEFNYIKLSTEDVSGFQEAAESFPVLSEKKLLVLKGNNLSSELKSDFVSFLEEFIGEIPEYTTVLFMSPFIDKKSRLYKLLKKNSTECVFSKQKTDDLVIWARKVIASKGKEADRETAYALINSAGNDMTLLMNEIEKLVSYAGNRTKITKEDVESICSRNIDSIVFKMIDSALDGKPDTAFLIYNDLKIKKEQPVAINGAITKYMIDILRFKAMKDDGTPLKAIYEKLNLHSSFRQRKYLDYSSKLSEKYLKNMINLCANLDIDLKSGGIDPYTGIGLLTSMLASKK